MSKKIEIKCEGAATMPYTELQEFQGGLKELRKERYELLKKKILTHGFSAPMFVWKTKDGPKILDGHQRLRTIKTMVEEEKYKCPDLPVCWIEADTEDEALRKVGDFTTVIGDFTDEGVLEWMQRADVGIGDLKQDYNFPAFDMPTFEMSHFKELPADITPRGGEDYNQLVDEFGTKRTEEGNDRYFYIEFYQHEEGYKEAKEILDPIMKTKHEVDRDKFLSLIKKASNA